jgi:hypothetical protein
MNLNFLKNKIAGAMLGIISLVLGIGLISSTTTQAQWRNDDRWERERERERRRQEREAIREQRRRARDAYRYGNSYPYGYGRAGDGYSNLGGSFQLRQTALNEGFNEGLKEGRRDRSRGEAFNFYDESAFRDATIDYSSKLGDRELYRRYFREAFENGYKDGYAGY